MACYGIHVSGKEIYNTCTQILGIFGFYGHFQGNLDTIHMPLFQKLQSSGLNRKCPLFTFKVIYK